MSDNRKIILVAAIMILTVVLFEFCRWLDIDVERLKPAFFCVTLSTVLGQTIDGTRSVRTFFMVTFWCLSFMAFGLGNSLTVFIETGSWVVLLASGVSVALSLIFPALNLAELKERLPLDFRFSEQR